MMKKLLNGTWVVFFVAAAFLLISSCATAPPAKEEAKAEPAKKEEAKPAAAAPAPTALTEADGVAKDGELARTNSPAFEMEYPTAMKLGNLEPGQIFNGSQGASPFSLTVAIADLNEGGWDAHIKAAEAGWKQALVALGGSDVEIVRSEPTDRYDEFKAHEIEIEWTWTDGSTGLTSVANYIEKEGKVIDLGGTVMGDIDDLISIFESIDLDP
jgi:hypothetical protein